VQLRSRGWTTPQTVVVGAALAVAGCGRRATPADCQLIVDRSVELQLQEQSESDPAAIARREREVRTQLEGEIKSCENSRVTDKTMACVRAARETKELDRCLH